MKNKKRNFLIAVGCLFMALKSYGLQCEVYTGTHDDVVHENQSQAKKTLFDFKDIDFRGDYKFSQVIIKGSTKYLKGSHNFIGWFYEFPFAESIQDSDMKTYSSILEFYNPNPDVETYQTNYDHVYQQGVWTVKASSKIKNTCYVHYNRISATYNTKKRYEEGNSYETYPAPLLDTISSDFLEKHITKTLPGKIVYLELQDDKAHKEDNAFCDEGCPSRRVKKMIIMTKYDDDDFFFQGAYQYDVIEAMSYVKGEEFREQRKEECWGEKAETKCYPELE